ncbi:amino acid transporter [Meredithblackwellia eburnea MCA 4105]
MSTVNGATEYQTANEGHNINHNQAPTESSANDVEKGHNQEKGDAYVATDGPGTGDAGFEKPLQRQLKNRHIAMISIGGVIGTGLFLGSANALRHGGPAGLLMGYGVMGSIVFCIMISLGEMVSHLPLPGGHITLAARFVDPALSFTMGWNYTYNWIIVLPAELSAAAVLISYWDKTTNAGVYIAVCYVVTVAINACGTRVYGEMEFWFCIIKVLTIVGLIFAGLLIDWGVGPTGHYIGNANWKNPGPFVQYNGIPGAKGRFLGFWAVLIQAAFSYIGTEITAIAAGEAKNPKRNLPKVIRRVWIRICLFYLGGVFVIGLLVPSNDPRLALGTGTAVSSPFVIAIQNAGIKALPSIINACLLTSAWSAGSSDMYTSSRSLYGLALNGNAPRIFKKVNWYGLPWVCVLVSAAFALLSFMSAGAAKAGEVFGWFANMTSVAGLLTWWGIAYTYTRFYRACKVQNIDRSEFPYQSRLQPYAAWYALIFISFILFFNAWQTLKPFDTADFLTSYFIYSHHSIPLPLCRLATLLQVFTRST